MGDAKEMVVFENRRQNSQALVLNRQENKPVSEQDPTDVQELTLFRVKLFSSCVIHSIVHFSIVHL